MPEKKKAVIGPAEAKVILAMFPAGCPGWDTSQRRVVMEGHGTPREILDAWVILGVIAHQDPVDPRLYEEQEGGGR